MGCGIEFVAKDSYENGFWIGLNSLKTIKALKKAAKRLDLWTMAFESRTALGA
jgi:hypothetical protein